MMSAHVYDVMAHMTGMAEKFAARMDVIESQMRQVWLAGSTAKAVPQQQAAQSGFGTAPLVPPQTSRFQSGPGLGQQPQFNPGLGHHNGLGHDSRPAQQQ